MFLCVNIRKNTFLAAILNLQTSQISDLSLATKPFEVAPNLQDLRFPHPKWLPWQYSLGRDTNISRLFFGLKIFAWEKSFLVYSK